MRGAEVLRVRIKAELDADVLIVGAGPAGAAVATHLARAGWRVLLVERQLFPRDKVCGDFVGPTALLELQGLGVSERPEFRSSNAIWRAALYVDGKEARLRDRSPYLKGFQVMAAASAPRARYLGSRGSAASRSKAPRGGKGPRLRSRAGCCIPPRENRRRGAHAAGAPDYRRRREQLDDCPRAPRRTSPGYRTNHRGAHLLRRRRRARGSSRSVLRGREFPWLLLAISDWQGNSKRRRGHGARDVSTKERALARHDVGPRGARSALRNRLARARIAGKIVGWPLATYDPSLAVFDERVLLVGDAAGFINPLNGEGIQYALLSARWAAECAINSLERGDFSREALRPYGERVERELRFDMAFAGMIVECIRNRHLNTLWLKLLSAIAARARVDSRYAEICGAVLAGLVPSNRLLSAHVIGRTIDQVIYSSVLAAGWSALQGPHNSSRMPPAGSRRSAMR